MNDKNRKPRKYESAAQRPKDRIYKLAPFDLAREFRRAKREMRSMWRSWTPRRSSVIWKLLGMSALVSALHYRGGLSLILGERAISDHRWWVTLTTGWVEPPNSPFVIILLLGVIAAMKSGALEGQVRRPRYFAYALSVFVGLLFINLILPGVTWSLISEGLMLIWFGAEVERRLGSRHFLILSVITLTVSYAVGVLYLTLGSGINVSGLRPLTRGLLVAWGYTQGRALLPFINLRGAQLRWVVYAFCGFEILLYPAPLGWISLAGSLTIDLWMQRYLKRSIS